MLIQKSVTQESLGNPKLFTCIEQRVVCNHTGCPKGFNSAFCANVGGNYNNDANADVFNVNANNSTSNTNDNIGAHHQGTTNYALFNPYHSVEIHNFQPEICTDSLVNSLEGE